jgi:hypothetical protein
MYVLYSFFIYFSYFPPSLCCWKGSGEKSVGHVVGHTDSEVLYEDTNHSCQGAKVETERETDEGRVVHVDTLGRDVDRTRERERERERASKKMFFLSLTINTHCIGRGGEYISDGTWPTHGVYL